MWTTPFKFALRTLLRERFFTLLNVTGLALGMAAAVLLGLWVQDERTFDQFHSRADRIYRILTNWQFGESREWIAQTPAPLTNVIRDGVPEIEQCVRQWRLAPQTFSVDGRSAEIGAVYIVDEGFFKLFDFSFIKGNAAGALMTPDQVVLTRKTAIEIFGNIPEINTTVSITGKGTFKVGGILDDLPSNSTVDFKVLLPWKGASEKYARNLEYLNNWGQLNYTTWVLLQPNTDAAQVASRLSDLSLPHRGAESADEVFYYSLQPIKDIHLYSDFIKWGEYGSLSTIRAVSWIAVLLLLVACMNYLNLASAQALGRARSIGVRKTIGANKSHLMAQSLLESGLVVGFATLLGMAAAYLALPVFEKFSGKVFSDAQIFSWASARIILGAAMLAWLGSGVQPAIQLARFRPVEAMKGRSSLGGKATLRKVLVTAQFVISIGLGICALVIFRQMQYCREAKLGFDRAHSFSFFIPKSEKAQVLREQLAQAPGISAVTLSDNPFVPLGSQCTGDEWEGMTPGQASDIWQINVDSDFREFFGLDLKEGRWFRPGHADSLSFILNESAVRMRQMDQPLGKWIQHGGVRGVIVGVARDFHFQSLHNAIEPMIFQQDPASFYVAYVKTAPNGTQQAVASAENVFKSVFPGKGFKYEFLDDQYNNLYKTEARTARLVALFTGLTLLISCIGLFGLAAFAARQRTKEIGVRKVLGASIAGITALLAREFVWLVIAALGLASPLAFYLMQRWLQDFAFHIQLHWWMFVAAGTAAMGIALLTISYQSIRAAMANPVHSLRNE
jgi:putative ABC transport system permease protein